MTSLITTKDIDRWFDPVAGGCTRHLNALECATHLASRYLSGDYTGSLFDPYGHEPPNKITRSDLLAVRSLSMPRFSRKSFLQRVGEALDDDDRASTKCKTTGCKKHVGCLLAQIPASSSIFRALTTTLALADGPLWKSLETIFTTSEEETGVASLSKTLARKRPGLLPILDSVALNRIKNAGGPGPSKSDNWFWFQEELQDSVNVAPGLVRIRMDASVSAHYTDLRLVDIVVWMRQTPTGRLMVDYGTCPPL